MQNIQEIFDRIREKKNEQKEIRQAYKDALTNTDGYTEIVDQIKKLRERKVGIERSVKGQSSKDFARLEVIQNDIKGDMELLSDLAVTKMMRGESIGFTDQNNNAYEPQFQVRFRKVI